MHCVCVSRSARGVTALLAAQLRQNQTTAALVTTHTYDFVKNPEDVETAVSRLSRLAVAGVGVRVIVDEAHSVK